MVNALDGQVDALGGQAVGDAWHAAHPSRCRPSDLVAGMDMYRNAYAHYGMRDPALLELADVIGAVLRDRVLSRAELAQEVRATGHVAPPVTDLLEGSWGSALTPASFLGHLCSGPNKAGSAAFTNPSTWLSLLPPAPSQTGALREIARRYFGVYAPATTQELAPGGGSAPDSHPDW